MLESKFSRIGLSAIFALVLHFNAASQCETCTPDVNCGGAANFPAVCPEQAVDAVAGEYYEQVLTFYIPNTFTEPSSGIEATIISITITSVSGLPFGLNYTLNDDDAVYFPSEGQNYGCATICGTPLLPGNYSVQISVSALVTAFGFELTQNESFPTTITVLPGESSTSSFTYDQPAGCGSIEVSYEAIIVAPAPAVTTYAWDFGNGQTSNVANPNSVIYDTEGDYTASLTTTVSEYKLQEVELINVAAGWDIDEDIFGAPDPFFNLIDGDGSVVYTSSVVENTSSNTWSDLDILLSNPPYALQFFDDDPISPDDNLGTANLTMDNTAFNAGNGTVGNVGIALMVTTEITDEATVTVFPLPDADFTVSGNVLTCNDQTLANYLWYRNGVMIADATQSTYTMLQGGQYYCEVQNEFGCVATSPSHLYCPAVIINYDATAMEMEVANIYSSYQWFFNGLPIEDATTYYVMATEPGNYAVVVTTSFGCTTTSEVYTLVVGVDEQEHSSFIVYPNPMEEIMYIKTTEMRGLKMLRISDVSGVLVYEGQLDFTADHTPIHLSGLACGMYNVNLNGSNFRIIVK